MTAVRLLAANVTALAVEVAVLRHNVTTLNGAVAQLQRGVGRSFLGADVYTTVVFTVSVFVALYQLNPNPTGYQDATGGSELKVYHQ